MLSSLGKGLAVGSAALLIIGIGAGTAQAADHTIHQDNTTTLNGVANGDKGDASHSYQQDGLHITVNNPDDGNNYVIQRWLTNTLLSQVHKVDYDWTGSQSRPGIKYDVDVDGDGSVDCELVGEQAYGGTDVWLNKDTYQLPGSNLGFPWWWGMGEGPSGLCSSLAPTHSSGSGSSAHGSLDQWAANFNWLAAWYNDDESCGASDLRARAAVLDEGDDEGDDEGSDEGDGGFTAPPNTCTDVARVLEEGIGASGLVQSGVMKRVGLGPENYYFGYPATASVSGPCAAVSGSYTFTRNIRTQQGRHGGRFVFTTGGTCSDQTVTWKVKVGRHTVKRFVQHAGGRAPFRFVNTNTYNAKTVTVLRNGVLQGSYDFDAAPKR